MKKFLVLVLIAQAYFLPAFSQQKSIDYGKNAAAGKYYTVRGIKIYCEIYGTGKPLLMLHGNGGSIASFKKNIPYFAKRYQVIAVDSRAHGKTFDSRDSLTFEMMADDFSALLNAMHIPSAYIIGWSDGGIDALVMAMRHPSQVIKLASSGANLVPDSSALIPSLWKDMQKEYSEGRQKQYKTPEEKNKRKIFMLDWLEPNIPFPALKVIKCPSLIMSGDHDLIVLDHTLKIFQNIPGAWLWVVPNSGHGTFIEHTDEVNNKIDEFFRAGIK
ncbi:alpha/beta hydrolase [soil metagenome]|jgi:pimeloyl-ACP methyl ester carboxylesterase